MSLQVFAKLSSGNARLPSLPPAMDKKCKEMKERRRVVEQARSMNVRRIQQELQRIAQREIEFAQRLLGDYTPVKLSVNEAAWQRWQDFLPIRLDFTESGNPETPASTQDETVDSPDSPIA